MFSVRSFIIVLSCILLASCSKEKRYNVPAEVEIHVQKFIDEGNARGHDIEIKRLIVTMVDGLESNGGPVAGRCLNPGARKPKIELDANFSNLSYEIQEQLIFHELGHCILERDHQDGFLANGHYNSLMNSFFWNYMEGQEFKRDYYLDELFNEEVVSPSWVSSPPTTYAAADTATMIALFTDEFDNNNNNWNLAAGQSLSINNGNLRIRTDCDTRFGFLRSFNINPGKDYQIETRMKIIDDNDQTNGIMWSMDLKNNYFGMNQNKESAIGILETGEPVVTAHPNGTGATDYNIYTVRVVDDKAYFFINHNFVDYRIISSHQVNSLGFLVGNSAIVEIDYLYVKEIP